MLQEFAAVKRKYTVLQDRLKAKGPPKATLAKVKQLKEEAEKLAEEIEKKIRRVTGGVLPFIVSSRNCGTLTESHSEIPAD